MRALPLLAAGLSILAGTTARAGPDESLSAGRWIGHAYCLGTAGSDQQLAELHVGFGRLLLDGLSFGLEAVGGYADFGPTHPSPRLTWSTGLDLALRWHALRAGWGSVFVDGEGGVRMFGESFPRRGTRYDFAAQVGVGATLRLADGVSLVGGTGWIHISNAALRGIERNPGYNAVKLYGGALLEW